MKFPQIAVFATCALLAAPVAAQDFGAGLAAAQAGDFAAALDNWKPLAEQGDADAQYNLALLFCQRRRCDPGLRGR